MKKTALLVVYNHRYNKNIPIIDKMYEGVFSHVYHLVPFYDGTQENVIPVYASSAHFQSYIAQAYTHLRKEDFTHFFVVADDMLLNPAINEENYHQKIGLGEDECYIDELWPLQDKRNSMQYKAMQFKVKQHYLEIESILPSQEEARKRFAEYGLPIGPMPMPRLTLRHDKLRTLRYQIKCLLLYFINIRRRNLNYPLIKAYSDILVIDAVTMPRFCQLCGAFAAGGLFVELAIPTALVLSTTRLKTRKDTSMGGMALWPAESDNDKEYLDSFNNSIDAVRKSFKEDQLYIHPIKLSKWK